MRQEKYEVELCFWAYRLLAKVLSKNSQSIGNFERFKQLYPTTSQKIIASFEQDKFTEKGHCFWLDQIARRFSNTRNWNDFLDNQSQHLSTLLKMAYTAFDLLMKRMKRMKRMNMDPRWRYPLDDTTRFGLPLSQELANKVLEYHFENRETLENIHFSMLSHYYTDDEASVLGELFGSNIIFKKVKFEFLGYG